MAIRNIDWQLDQSSMLSGFSYHDGTIVEFKYFNPAECQGPTLTVKIRNLDKRIVELSFKNLTNINITEFDLDSIVNDIEVRSGSDGQFSGRFWARFWTILLPELRITKGSKNGEISRLLKNHQDAYFVQLYASYGATFALICQEIAVQEE